MNRPLAWIAVSFSFGIFFSSFIKAGFIYLFIGLLIFLILSAVFIRRKLLFNIILLCIFSLLGAVLLKNSQILSKCHIRNFISYKNNEPYIVKGYIENEPEVKLKRNIFVLRAESIQIGEHNHKCCGKIMVYLKSKKQLHYGQGLVLSGKIYRPYKRGNRQNYAAYLANQGIYLLMNVKSEADLLMTSEIRGAAPKRFAFWLKERIEKIIQKNLTPLAAAISEAMILGEKKNIPYFVQSLMMKTGTIHILVVSGFNVGIVAFIIILLLKLLRVARRPRIFIAAPTLIIYCLMTGASTPVVRATLMGIIFLGAYLVKREPDIYNCLAVAALFILAINPRQLFDVGFQLSFASVISIVYLFPKIKALLRVESISSKYIRYAIDSCLVSFSAWLGTMGFIAYYFRIFSPVTVLANIFVVPIATFITLSGFSMVAMALVSADLTRLFSASLEISVIALLKINNFLVAIPGSWASLS